MEWPMVVLLGVVAVGVVATLLKRDSRDRRLHALEGQSRVLDLLQQQLLEMGRELRGLKEAQTDTPRVLAEGQVRQLESLQQQFAQLVGTVTQQMALVSTQLTRGQGEASQSLTGQLEAHARTLNEQMGRLTKLLGEQLGQTQGTIGERLDNTAKVVAGVERKLGELSESAKQLQELGKEVHRLQMILQAPKLRGGLGELFLEELLKQILPRGNFVMQHSFKSGGRVDAVLKLGEHLVAIDSKFPLESFTRMLQATADEERRRLRREFAATVRDRVVEIAVKYIRPEEGTLDFAFMYIPAENVYYEVMVKEDGSDGAPPLLEMALAQRVIPVSPSTLYAYLSVVAFGLRGLKVEEEAKKILAAVTHIQQEFQAFYKSFSIVGKALKQGSDRFRDAAGQAERLHDRMGELTGSRAALPEAADPEERNSPPLVQTD